MPEETRRKISEARKRFFANGGKPPTQGKHLSAETRRKISEANTGKRRSPEILEKMRRQRIGRRLSPLHRKRIGLAHKRAYETGKRRAYWAGKKMPVDVRRRMHDAMLGKNRIHGLNAVHVEIRKSLEYRLWREAVFARDNYTCRFCRVRGGTLNADHIKPFALFPELRFSIDNGRTLCVPCHRSTPTYGANTKRQ